MRLTPLVLTLLVASSAAAENWPSWRGPTAQGISRESGAPLSWSKDQNVVWRTELPGAGNSTPIVWGDHIFVTQPVKEAGRRTVIAFHRVTGKQLWQSGVSYTAPDPSHQTNPHCSASPATDGAVVVAWYGAAGLAAYGFDGKELWKRDLGVQKHVWGYGSSPVIHGDRVFLNFGPGERSFLIAVDKNTGKTIWRKDLPKGTGKAFSNWNPEDMYGSWASPVVLSRDGRDELLVSLPHRLTAFDPATGAENWSSEGLGDLIYPTPVVTPAAILALSGFGGPVLAAKPGGERIWHKEKSKNSIGSGVVRDGFLYVIDNGGIAECWEVATGKVMWTSRLQGKGESNAVWSSPVLQGDRIYVMNQGGDTFVFQASPKQFELLASNPLGERSNSSVVISHGDVILRTHSALYRIGTGR
jgi:outer membrane protein assembly factor BamB